MNARPHAPAALLAALLALTLAGCSSRVWGPDLESSEDAAGLIALPSPSPVSPAQAVRALEWAIDHRNPSLYAALLTDDFRFYFSVVDSAGNAYGHLPLTREDEAQIAHHLFVTGTATEPRALRARLTLPRDLVTAADLRPGKEWPWHQIIRTPALLEVDTRRTSYRISTFVTFYLVRGDSAQIPPDLVARGFGPDPSRWWIERWDEETISPAGASLLPVAREVRRPTWAALKLLYR